MRSIILQYKKLCLNAEVESETHASSARHLTAENIAAARLEGFALAPQITGKPSGIPLPW